MPWSDWQDGYDNTFVVIPDNIGNAVSAAQVGIVTSPAADLNAEVIQILSGSGSWADHYSLAGFGLLIQGYTSGAFLFAAFAYEGVTLLGSGAEVELPEEFPPGGLPDDSAPIPPDQLDDRVLGGIVQFESKANTFLNWEDADPFTGMLVSSDDGAGNPVFGPADPGPSSFTPPSSITTIIGITDPVSPIGPQEGVTVNGWRKFPGPHLLPSEVETLTTYSTDPRSTDRASAPYTVDAGPYTGELLDVQEVPIPLSGQGRKDLTLYAMPGDYFSGVPLPLTGDFGPNDRGFSFSAFPIYGAYVIGSGQERSFFGVGTGFAAQMHSPRWRYWIADQIYTIGGHWSDANGVVVKRLKDDGVTWIPIVDGLAPPLL